MSLELTYYRHGDTHERGMALAALGGAYRAAGFGLSPTQLPDFLPALLELAAVDSAGAALLGEHRMALDALHGALEHIGSTYAEAVAALRDVLPSPTRSDRAALARYRTKAPLGARRARAVRSPRGHRLGARLGSGSAMSHVTGFQLWWWVILPYLALATFVIGHIWRYRYDQFGWTSRSTELQEKKLLKWGSPIFHYGTFAAISGHIIGILIPESWTAAIGIPESAYRWFSAGAGTLAAVLIIIGVAILAARRLFVPRVRATTSPVDWVALILLAIVIVMGIAETRPSAWDCSAPATTTATAWHCGSEGCSSGTPTWPP